MDWLLGYSARKEFADSPFQLGRIFNSPLLIVRVFSAEAQPSWKTAGTLFPILSVSNVGLVEGVGRRAYLRTKLLKFENLGLPFDLKFQSVGYLPSVTVTVWEPESPFFNIETELHEINQRLELIANRDIETDYLVRKE